MLRATRESNPGCQWVFDGEGVATRKYDGACCMVRDSKLYKRRELSPKQSAPAVRLAVSRGDTRTGAVAEGTMLSANFSNLPATPLNQHKTAVRRLYGTKFSSGEHRRLA
jgi:hypothetical protein